MKSACLQGVVVTASGLVLDNSFQAQTHDLHFVTANFLKF